MLAVYLFLCLVGSSCLKLSAIEHCVNIKFCVFLHKSPSETLQRHEEAYGKVAGKEIEVYE